MHVKLALLARVQRTIDVRVPRHVLEALHCGTAAYVGYRQVAELHTSATHAAREPTDANMRCT
jgi:hypothetical protein